MGIHMRDKQLPCMMGRKQVHTAVKRLHKCTNFLCECLGMQRAIAAPRLAALDLCFLHDCLSITSTCPIVTKVQV